VRFASLGSGSRGNATIVTAGSTTILVDCGFSVRETAARLARAGVDPEEIDAILVTHEHEDHVGGVGALARRYGAKVWSTAGTRRSAAGALGEVPRICVFSSHDSFAIGDLLIEPIAVPHDASEPTQFVFSDGQSRVGLLTDAGCITPHIRRMLSGLSALLLEFNHDEEMLRRGPYPAVLKQRISSDLGHLSNAQSAALLREIDTHRLQHLVALHLSQQNNDAGLVRAAAAAALNCSADWIGVADQDGGYGWREICAGV